jgi:hypothetical protein
MDTRSTRFAKRLVVALLLAGGLGGCAVYAPPYAAYDSAYPYYYSDYGYGYPTYVGPPVSLNFGFYEHRHRGYGGWRHGHGWKGHGGGWGHGRGWGHRRGGRH